MSKYVMANRRAGRRTVTDSSRGATLMSMALETFASGIQIVKEHSPDGPMEKACFKFEADPEDVAQMKLSMGYDVILEPEMPHYLQIGSPFNFPAGHAKATDDIDPGEGQKINLVVLGGGKPIKDSKVTLTLNGIGDNSKKMIGRTSKNGRVSFRYSDFWTAAAVVVEPREGFWHTVRYGPVSGDKIHCDELPKGPFGWWHNECGITDKDLDRGAAIRIGVCDTGVGTNGNLAHVTDIGSFVGANNSGTGRDVSNHGTHVLGLIGARPSASKEFFGVAPGVDLYSARVFSDSESEAKSDDIGEAITSLWRDHSVDIINLSLGYTEKSEFVADRIKEAFENGTICICAAGNTKRKVLYPAALKDTVAVSAIGKLGKSPPGSLSSTRLPDETDKFGNKNLYLANFSCTGEQITCCAPGVGIISTVPSDSSARTYAALDGSSMSAPIVAGIAANQLYKHPSYKTMARNQIRSQVAIQAIRDTCDHIGLVSKFSGSGIPRV